MTADKVDSLSAPAGNRAVANRRLVESGALDGVVIALGTDVADLNVIERDPRDGMRRIAAIVEIEATFALPLEAEVPQRQIGQRENWKPVLPPWKSGGCSGSSASMVTFSMPETKWFPGYSPGLIFSVVPDFRPRRAERSELASRTTTSSARTAVSGASITAKMMMSVSFMGSVRVVQQQRVWRGSVDAATVSPASSGFNCSAYTAYPAGER